VAANLERPQKTSSRPSCDCSSEDKRAAEAEAPWREVCFELAMEEDLEASARQRLSAKEIWIANDGGRRPVLGRTVYVPRRRRRRTVENSRINISHTRVRAFQTFARPRAPLKRKFLHYRAVSAAWWDQEGTCPQWITKQAHKTIVQVEKC
jgi:hypothetical protein